MVTVTGNHLAAVQTIQALMDELVDRGAWFNKDLRIEVKETGEVMVSADKATDKLKNYMRIPVSLLPPLELFDLSLDEGNEFVCIPKKDDPTVPLMQYMVTLYNQTDKIGLWQRAWPFSALSAANGLLDYLAEARGNSPKIKQYRVLLKSGDQKRLLLESFLSSRQFNLKAKWFSKHDENMSDESRKVLLPMIDLLNHHSLANPFDIKETPEPNMRVYMKPDPDTGELFIRYNQYDAVDTYLFYGFVDTQAPWLFSVPIKLSLRNKTFEVMGQNAPLHGKLPRALQDLRAFMPMVIKHENDVIQITRLIVPHERAPMALRRILRSLVNSFTDKHLSHDETEKAVLDLEAQVLEQNQRYWDTIDKAHQAARDQGQLPSQANEALQTLVNWAYERLQAYRARL